jgi:hypothetical protein
MGNPLGNNRNINDRVADRISDRRPDRVIHKSQEVAIKLEGGSLMHTFNV